MSDKYDRYRESLVVETSTVWPSDCALPRDQRDRIAAKLHADASACGQLEYVRVPTGFCRKITVTQEDLQRIG